MNTFFSPDLLLLSGRIVVLLAATSILAFLIGWLCSALRASAKKSSSEKTTAAETNKVQSTELEHAHAVAEELRRSLAATESQCVAALEQRDEAERKAVDQAAEIRKVTEQLASLKGDLAARPTTHQGEGDEATESVVADLRSSLVGAEKMRSEAISERDDALRQVAELRENGRKMGEALRALEESLGNKEAELRTATEKVDQWAAAAERLSAETTSSLEQRETMVSELAGLRAEQEALQREHQTLQNAHAGTLADVARLKQQLASADALVAVRDGQIEQLLKDRVDAEAPLKARIAELESVAHEPPKPAIRLPKPPLPPAEVLAAPLEGNILEFPRAPEETGRRPLGESLFDESAIASFSPEVPSLEDARSTLEDLEQELQEKEQVMGVLTADQALRWDELEAIRRAPPEERQVKLHEAEKAESAATGKLVAAAADRDRCRRQVRALRRSLKLAEEHAESPLRVADDLTRIKGIKAGISQQLHAFGIFTYQQIVEWDEEDMQAFSELLAFKNRAHRDKWQEQARALMVAKYGKV